VKILFLEPFFGGSHKDFAEGLVSHSRHEITLETMPARFWKWRMRGAALHFMRECPPLDRFDALVTTDLMSLSDFKSLAGPACPPALVYFHENQLTYPLAPGERMDVHFGFTDITTALAADRILFNSHTHMKSFFSHLPRFIRNMPEFRPLWVVETIREKAEVLYPGCHLEPCLSQEAAPAKNVPETAPLIVWNHRWEFDKNPGAFFSALERLVETGPPFRLALLGENFQAVPKPFLHARERFADQIVQYGYLPSRTDYHALLRQGAVVVSTALQENFGIAVVEAVHAGALPLLPNRLSYPEIVPADLHTAFLYERDDDIAPRLKSMLESPQRFTGELKRLQQRIRAFAWSESIDAYDRCLERLVEVPRKI
jgi:glycosyltransferase involved in cell wall biosynthesis